MGYSTGRSVQDTHYTYVDSTGRSRSTADREVKTSEMCTSEMCTSEMCTSEMHDVQPRTIRPQIQLHSMLTAVSDSRGPLLEIGQIFAKKLLIYALLFQNTPEKTVCD